MPEHENVIKGIVAGPVVQARSILGDVHLNLPSPAPVALAGLPPGEGFIGRAEHLGTLSEMLGEESGISVCVIAGLAGVGKTALAVRSARLAMSDGRFPGGVLFVDLQGYDSARVVDAHTALGSFIRALGISGEHIPPEPGERELLYRSVMAARANDHGPMLVVADNAAELDQILPLRPGESVHRMLVTSRHSLPVPAARRVELDALPLPEALAMLASSLTTSDPADSRITADPERAAVLAELCGRLPLALGITAHLLADHPQRPLDEMVTLLQDAHDRIGEFTYGGSVAVRAAFDASYRRLSAEQARAFRFLALNPGPHISIEAAGALLDQSAEAARRLVEDLRRAHLLQPATGNNTYRFHDLLRIYAEDWCRREQTGIGEALARLLAYYEHVAVAADSHLLVVAPDGGRSTRFATRDAALEWFDAERPNLVAAVERAAASGHQRHAVAITHHMYWFFQLRKHWIDWVTTHDVALVAARETGDDVAAGMMLNRIGNIYQERSQPARSIPCYEEALTLFEEAADTRGQAHALVNLGVVFTKLGRPDKALEYHHRALTLYQRIGDRRGESQVTTNTGAAYWALERYDEALQYYLRAVDICRGLDDRVGEARSFSNLGNLYASMDRLSDSLTAYHTAVAIYREMSDESGAGLALTNLGITYRDHGDVGRALECFTQAVTAYETVSATADIDWVQSLIAQLPKAPGRIQRLLPWRWQGKSR